MRMTRLPWLFTLVLLALAPPTNAEIVTITVGPVLPTAEPQWVDDTTFTSAILNSTNTYRDEHNATALAWNATLEAHASAYLGANRDCAVRHSGGPYGENIALGYPNATASVEAWGDERRAYDFGRAEYSLETGHFTQLVWKGSSAVGCARRLCEAGWYLACEYWPRGNVGGQFAAEVGRQIKGDTGAASVVAPSCAVSMFAVSAMILLAM